MPDGLNKVMLIGNLGVDPEMRYTANGSAVTSFRIAVGRSYLQDEQRKEETEWVQIVTWNKLAETCGAHLAKGRKVYVEGRLASRSWDGPDGQKRYRTEVVANAVLFLDRAGVPAGGVPEEDIESDELPFE